MPSLISLMKDSVRKPTPSVADHLRSRGETINPLLIRPGDREGCRWLNYHFRKGVTSPSRDMTVIGGEAAKTGLHGNLIAGIPGTDPTPRCYDQDHDKGFDDFVRWVYFTDPADRTDFLGIDFSLSCRSTAGVATTMLAAADTVRALVRHGLPADTEVVLLNPRMIEEPGIMGMRRATGLLTAADWVAKEENVFGPKGRHCPRCGLRTITDGANFCCRCGADPAIVRKNRKRG